MFKNWIQLESSLNHLHQSAVDAFPSTTKRQHSVDPIVITKLTWVPFRGMKTLFVKGLAQNIEEGTEYNTTVLFKKINFNEQDIILLASDGKQYEFGKLNPDMDTLVRCTCPDFHWRFNYYDHLDHSLFGKKRGPYESMGGKPANPKELPGMCKHLMKMNAVLQKSGLY